jgi:hypothetical protein
VGIAETSGYGACGLLSVYCAQRPRYGPFQHAPVPLSQLTKFFDLNVSLSDLGRYCNIVGRCCCLDFTPPIRVARSKPKLFTCNVYRSYYQRALRHRSSALEPSLTLVFLSVSHLTRIHSFQILAALLPFWSLAKWSARRLPMSREHDAKLHQRLRVRDSRNNTRWLGGLSLATDLVTMLRFLIGPRVTTATCEQALEVLPQID